LIIDPASPPPVTPVEVTLGTLDQPPAIVLGTLVLSDSSRVHVDSPLNVTVPLQVRGNVTISSSVVVLVDANALGGASTPLRTNNTYVALIIIADNGSVISTGSAPRVVLEQSTYTAVNADGLDCLFTVQGHSQVRDNGRSFGVLFTSSETQCDDDDSSSSSSHSDRTLALVLSIVAPAIVVFCCVFVIVGTTILYFGVYKRGYCFWRGDDDEQKGKVWEGGSAIRSKTPPSPPVSGRRPVSPHYRPRADEV
jgi:hypothetical protein